MRDTLTYPEYREEFDTGSETLDSILVVLEFLSEFLDFYLP
jgi:hypothetical protein